MNYTIKSLKTLRNRCFFTCFIGMKILKISMMLNSVKEINDILTVAIARNITDIHFELRAAILQVRFREDGFLKKYKEYLSADTIYILTRLKVMANLDINLKVPQDGRFNYANVDIRVSTMPTYLGEKIVLRLLLAKPELHTLTELGLPEFIIEELNLIIKKLSGLILVTGPTGSGKTTTLYAILRICNAEQKNIVTIEDPVEYQLPGINQIQINNNLALSFSTLLRSVLRQDPDIIFIGEVRDAETATIAIRAALTGHLVLATLHTRDSKETITRLKDLGIPEYLIRDTVSCVIGQRLFRKLCPACLGKGCSICGEDGFKGRSGIYEFYLPQKNILYDFQSAKADILKKGITREQELFFI